MGLIAGIGSATRHAVNAFVKASLVAGIVATLAFGVVLFGSDPLGASDVSAGQKPAPTATMALSPTIVYANETVHLTGTGLDPTLATWVRTDTATAVGWWSVQVNPDGSYATDLSFPQPGSVTVSVVQVVNRRSVLKSTCTITVQ